MKPDLKLVENTGSELEPDTFDPPPQQSEMPFAIVDGEPMTEMPKDLYIPPDALQVFLEAFEGPLDLLLYMIRRQNLDILDIPIAEITRQYMKYIEVMAELQLELAGEYLLMAAMLAEIKSRMLLPRPPSVDGQDEEDPRAELVRRLQEYERFKKAAEDIDQLPRMERDTMAASAELIERKVVKMAPQVSLQEMLLAFKDVLSRAEMFAHHHVARERLSVRQRMSDILSTLRESAFLEFVNLFRPEEGRMGVTVTFIAILELMKEGLLEIVQAEPYAPIHVRPASGSRHLTIVGGNNSVAEDADAENAAALAQPAHPDEDDLDEDVEDDDSLAAALDEAAVVDPLQSQAAEAEPTTIVADDTNVTIASAAEVDAESSADDMPSDNDEAFDTAELHEEVASTDVDAAAASSADVNENSASVEESVTDDSVTLTHDDDENTGQGQ